MSRHNSQSIFAKAWELVTGACRPTRRSKPTLALIALALGIAAPTIGKAAAVGTPDRHANPIATYLHAKAGDLIDVTIGELHPTQAVLGYLEVFYKLGRYEYGKDTLNKRFSDWCEANGQKDVASADPSARLDDPASFNCVIPLGQETDATVDPMKTVVIGRGGRLYLVDGHHTFTSFLTTPDGGPNLHVRVRVLANLSTVGPDEFWREMEAGGWVWLRDENNQPITADQLPESLGLGNFRNDDYRGLVYFTRDIAYTQNAENANYQEFHWGAWLRDPQRSGFDLGAFDLTNIDGYLAAVKKAAELMSALPDTAIVDGDLTAGDLGRKDFDSTEWGKLAKKYSESKPGKVAYAFKFLEEASRP